MGELITALTGGLLIAMFNKFVLSGISGSVFQWCEATHLDDDDGLSSQSSTISADIHVHH
jgi:hypothetical protein